MQRPSISSITIHKGVNNMQASIKLINFILVCGIFFGLSYAALFSIAQYNPSVVKRGIELTVNGPGSNYIHSHNFGNTVQAK